MRTRGERGKGIGAVLALLIGAAGLGVAGCDLTTSSSGADPTAAKPLLQIMDLGPVFSTDPDEDFDSGAPPA